MTTRSEPLAGVRVLELGQFITAPYAGLLLADLGAEVIKIERPGEGDPFRSFRSGKYSPNFCAYNRNKKSVALDITTPAGCAAVLALAANADVLIENFRPGVMDRLGLGWDRLQQSNPRLVYCSVSGFSADGPARERPAYDIVGQAMSGMLGVFVNPDDPRVTGPTIADQVTGFYACYGVLGALLRRGADPNKAGGKVDVAMVEAAMSFMPDFFSALTQGGMQMGPETRAAFSHSFVFRCSDARLVAIQLSSIEKFWRALCVAIERPELANDARFVDRMTRIANFEELLQTLRPTFAAQPRSHWMTRLADHDVPFAPVHSIAEAKDDPEVRHLGSFIELRHPIEGKVTALRRPVRLDGEREKNMLPPPALGEHTEVLLREAGLEAAAIDRLLANVNER